MQEIVLKTDERVVLKRLLIAFLVLVGGSFVAERLKHGDEA